MGHRMQAQKMKLVFEHNLVAAMKKYVPSRDAFFQCLKLAKMNTISQKRELYRALLKHNDIKSESEYGFRFSRESKMRGKK
jgi:hypothetical protein